MMNTPWVGTKLLNMTLIWGMGLNGAKSLMQFGTVYIMLPRIWWLMQNTFRHEACCKTNEWSTVDPVRRLKRPIEARFS